MTLTVGRCGVDVTLPEPRMCDLQGNTLRLGGFLEASSLADVLVLRQQLQGLVDSPDEPVVPISWTIDTTINGFYRVLSISVIPGHFAAFEVPAQAAFVWEGEFERIAGFGSPQIETIATFPVLTNGSGVTGAEISAVTAQDLWYPAAVTEISHVYGAAVTRDTADGDVYQVVGANQPPSSDTVRWSIAAADYYDAACSFQVGTSFRTFIGRQVEYSTLSSALDDWRIQNSLVRVSWDTSDDTMVVQHYDGTTWETAKKYKLWLGGVGNNRVDALVAVRVLVNTSERVTVRIALTSTDDQGTLINCDLTVLRGERMVRITFTSPNVVTWGIARDTSEAGTDTSAVAPFSSAAGLRATSNDAGGNRYVIASSAVGGIVTENTIGAVDTAASVAAALFMISTEIAGSGAAAWDTAERQIISFLAGTNQQQIVSVR